VLAQKLRRLLLGYFAAGGTCPVLLVYGAGQGVEIIDLLARCGDGLPARVLPFPVESTTQIGLDAIATAFAFGVAELRVLVPIRPRTDLAPLREQIALAGAILSSLGYGAGRCAVIEADEPDALAMALHALDARKGPQPAGYLPLGIKRDLMRTAMRCTKRARHRPSRSPCRRARRSAASRRCGWSLSCVSACPTGALRDNPERPALSFVEDACVQCGICRATCPERVITLEPRLVFGRASREPVLIKEEEPATCVRCGKPSGTKAAAEKVVEKLRGKHWLFGDAAAIERLRMCADCRVVAQFESKLDPYAGPPGLDQQVHWGTLLIDLGVTAKVTPTRLFTDTDRAIEWAEDQLLAVKPGDREGELPFEELDMLANLERSELAAITPLFVRHAFEKGEIVFREAILGASCSSSRREAPASRLSAARVTRRA
jgi:ferredoxin